jgi:hypothetical protein
MKRDTRRVHGEEKENHVTGPDYFLLHRLVIDESIF